MKTKYRAVPSKTGVFQILEYLNGNTWEKVLDGIYDNVGNKQDYFDFQKYVSSYNHNLSEFVKNHSDLRIWENRMKLREQVNAEKRESLKQKIEQNQTIYYF